MRAAPLVVSAFVIAACSGTSSSIITQGGDSGSSSGGDGAASDGAHGGDDTGGGDGSTTGDDAGESGVTPQDAGGHETGVACTPSPPDGGACNSLLPPPPSITIQCDTAQQVPAATGGIVRDGLYVMTSSTHYAGGSTCPTPEVDGVAWLVCGSSWQIAQTTTVSGQPPSKLVANATVVPTGTDLGITLTCGITSPPITFGYDATATTLRLHINGSAPNGRIDTFTRQ